MADVSGVPTYLALPAIPDAPAGAGQGGADPAGIDDVENWAYHRIAILERLRDDNVGQDDFQLLAQLDRQARDLLGLKPTSGGSLPAGQAALRWADAVSFLLLHIAAAADADLFERHTQREALLFRRRCIGGRLSADDFIRAVEPVLGGGVRALQGDELPPAAREVLGDVPAGETLVVIDDFLRVAYLLPLAGRPTVPVGGRIYLREGQLAGVLAQVMAEVHGSPRAFERAQRLRQRLEAAGHAGLLARVAARQRENGAAVENIRGGAVTADNVSACARSVFPPCAVRLVQNFEKDHHLRYMGRQQLTLFLKGIGLPFAECDRYMGRIFQGTYVRNYRYNVAHCYGLVGGRHDYTPYSCAAILRFSPGAGEYHGCPFFTMGQDQLLHWLAGAYAKPLGADAIDRIRAVRPTLNPQSGCRELFDALFPGRTGIEPARHPTTWVREALRAQGMLPDVEEPPGQ